MGPGTARAIERTAERIDDAPEQGFAHRGIEDAVGSADLGAGFDTGGVVEQNDADVIGVEIKRHAEPVSCEAGPVLPISRWVSH